MKLLPSIIILLLFCIVASCSQNKVSNQLDLAESLMDERPDSAMKVISVIDEKNLSNESERAKYVLLYTQAQTKNNIIIYDNSKLALATKYFKKKDMPKYLMQSLFYCGDIELNNDNLSKSMTYAIKSYDIAIKLKDWYWRAKTAELLEDIFAKSINNAEMKKYAREASIYYQKAGKTLNHRYALCDYASSLANDGFSDRSLTILDSISNLATDSALIAYTYHAYLPILMQTNDFEKATLIINKIIEFSKYYPISAKEFSYLSQIELYNDNFSKAEKILSFAKNTAQSKSDSVSILFSYAKYYEKIGEYTKSKQYTDSLLLMQNLEVEKILRQSVIGAQRDYYNNKSIEESHRASTLAIVIIFIIVIAIVSLLLVTTIFRFRDRVKSMEIESKMNDILLITNELNNYQRTNIKLSQHINKVMEDYNTSRQVIQKLFREKWQTMDLLCSEYNRVGDSPKTKSLILKDIETEIDRLRNTNNASKIIDSVNQYMDNIINKLREQCPFIKENDIMLISLIYAGFSARAISLILKLNNNYFYKKKSRLIQRISLSNAKDKELFLEKLQ